MKMKIIIVLQSHVPLWLIDLIFCCGEQKPPRSNFANIGEFREFYIRNKKYLGIQFIQFHSIITRVSIIMMYQESFID